MLYKLIKWIISLFTRKPPKPAQDPFATSRDHLIARLEEEQRPHNIRLRPTTRPNRMVIEADNFIQAYLLYVHLTGIRQIKRHTAGGTIHYTSPQPGNLTLQLTDQSAHPRQLGHLRLNDTQATDRQFNISIIQTTPKTNKV